MITLILRFIGNAVLSKGGGLKLDPLYIILISLTVISCETLNAALDHILSYIVKVILSSKTTLFIRVWWLHLGSALGPV